MKGTGIPVVEGGNSDVDVLNSLRNLGPLHPLHARTLAGLAAAATVERVGAGHVLFRRGDEAGSFYAVVQGQFEMLAGIHEDNVRLGIRAAGSSLGGSTMLPAGRYLATARAISDSTVIRLDRPALDSAMASDERARGHMTRFATRRLPSSHLAISDLFAGIDPEAARAFDVHATMLDLPAGATLFEQGATGDAMYVIADGRMRILAERPDGSTQDLAHLGRGAVVGEMALLTDRPRSATVRAMRDSSLVRISRAGLDELLRRNPSFVSAFLRTLALRIEMANTRPPARDQVSIIAVLPGEAGFEPGFTVRLEQALKTATGSAVRVDSARADRDLGPGSSSVGVGDPGNARLLHWIDELEAAEGTLLLECDPTDSAWTRRCLRAADVVVLVRDATAHPTPGPIETAVLAGSHARLELVLIHPDATALPSGTSSWLEPRRVERHHHVRSSSDADLARVARHLTGHALGVALSGGGARGFAHIGVVQALTEAGLPVDFVGGTSMGALIGAQVAMGFRPDEVLARTRDAFGKLGLARDLTLPLSSLVSARRIVRMLKGLYGEIAIEDLWLPYFCVSANLTRAELVVHESGPLWLWVRASSSVPGIEPPVSDGGSLYVDGGVLNNLPGDVMRRLCDGPVVAVDVSPERDLAAAAGQNTTLSGWRLLLAKIGRRGGGAGSPSILAIMSRTTMLSSVHNSSTVKALVDLYIHPPTDRFDPFDWAHVEDISAVGLAYGAEQVAAWKATRAVAAGVSA